ncbi:uncharacterized protein LOC130724967 [Lotus japonicus]|uniref:uncharacterized protein LOC130724967 n=1 Tax=Lotus japonicus TaxID=34305 RepID=UPI00258EFAFA|nr:uncharacterized protein LOC130724967 [Lotus japonicus]
MTTPTCSARVGIANGDHRVSSPEELDQMARSTKKVKTVGISDPDDVPMPQSPTDMEEGENHKGPVVDSQAEVAGKISYRDKVVEGECFNNLFSPQEILESVHEDLCLNDAGDRGLTKARGPFNPNPIIPISIEEYSEWCRPWKNSLIVKLLGKKLGFRWMNQRLQRLWAREGEIKVMDLSEDYFLVRFSSENDYKLALFEGPWMVADHYLMIQRWRPMFKADDSQVQKIAVWIRIPKLPVELFTETFLWRLGSNLGTMLKMILIPLFTPEVDSLESVWNWT